MSHLFEKDLRPGLHVIPAGMRRLPGPFILLALILSSCATLPPSRGVSQWIGVLPPMSPQSVYASINPSSARSLFELMARTAGAETEQLERITTSIHRAFVQIRFSPGGAPSFSLIALGEVKTTSVALQLNLDPAWERVLLSKFPDRGFTGSHWSYRTYWRNTASGLQIACPQRGMLFVAGGAPTAAAEMLQRLQSPGASPLPAEAALALETEDIFLYFPDPAGLAASSDPGLLPKQLPIRQIWITATARQDSYEVGAMFVLSEVENLRAVELLLRLMLTLWLRTAGVADPVKILRTAEIHAEQGSARIESLSLTTPEIVSFFQALLPEAFSTYGQPQ
jgi:hypothetical protein